MTHKLLIDTDPGVDDAIALLLALGSSDIQVVALTTIFGNTDTSTATRNAQFLVELAGRSAIPVARGADRPLLGEPSYAERVHGENALGGYPLPPPKFPPSPFHAAELIVQRVMAAPGEITIVALGPLTNLALALELEPRLRWNVRSVVVMGGAFDVPGNVTATAEANIHNDPFAAQRVLTAGWPLTVVGLDVTTRVVMTPSDLRKIPDHPVGAFIWDISRVYEGFHAEKYGFQGFYAHDPTAIAYVLAPSLFKLEETAVRVTTSGPELGRTTRTRSMYIPAYVGGQLPRVCVDVDASGVLERIRSHLNPPLRSR